MSSVVGNTIAVVGGGAAGMMAAIQAARRGAKVFILEHKEDLGKKILSTGNGRCNLTNMDMSKAYYRGSGTQIADQVLSRFSAADTRAFFRELGLLTKTRDTYVYPRCDQASAVAGTLQLELWRLDVKVYAGVHVAGIERKEQGFLIVSSDGRKFTSDAVILAAGGRAAPALGSDGSGYSLARALGHTVTLVAPALVPLKTDPHPFRKASGVRTQACVCVCVDGREQAKDTGELQITDYGVSGIPIFQVSRFASLALCENKRVEVCIDFLPDLDRTAFISYFKEQADRRKGLSAADLLCGIFPKKLSPRLLEMAGIRNHTLAADLRSGQIMRLSDVCKCASLTVTGTKGFEYAQVCAGGVPAAEIDASTMESRIVSGLYMAGELLDVDGVCGGYNIQFALSSGYIAGVSA